MCYFRLALITFKKSEKLESSIRELSFSVISSFVQYLSYLLNVSPLFVRLYSISIIFSTFLRALVRLNSISLIFSTFLRFVCTVLVLSSQR